MDNLTKLYQHGTLAMLIEGMLKGTMTMKDLLAHGDTGLGTGEGLHGELVVLDGHPYLAQADGTILEAGPDFVVPYASVHFQKPEVSIKVEMENVRQADLHDRICEFYPYENIFYGITIRGEFRDVNTRIVKKQCPPYPKLVEVAEQQATFHKDHVKGAVVGYFSPELFNGSAVSGNHVHFVADDKSIGGHLLDFELVKGEVMIQPFSTIETHFPLDYKEFMCGKINLHTLADELERSEK
ncbi:hypothetical protein A6A19_00090 [Actinobacillus delphinicola]|uniref:Alpha-acetolactate decarboxylase n=1 Tax=Actinobacillus delphinicola TaxID=51161 RepID=A0A448TVJ6_9PAST|nr:acetolactate decarboxylase [Actinobacillus delphinicola]MDG6896445.1 hypothetical protein [Actinobacillus delphinicola]VEJ09955.1 Alpha-acetolactate decarboxylase [Actinobacillus delphinicola]